MTGNRVRNTKLLIGAVLLPAALLAWSYLTDAGRQAGLAWNDVLFELRGTTDIPEDIVIVAIDETSFSEMGMRWPWPRTVHAELVRRLKQAGAGVIAFDLIFSEPSGSAAEDAVFAEAIRDAGNVILGESFGTLRRRNFRAAALTAPLPLFSEAAAGTGVVNFFPDLDGFIRRGIIYLNGHPSFAAAVAERMHGGPSDPQGMRNRDFLINFPGPAGTVKTVSYYQALDPDLLPDDFFRDRAVIIGVVCDAGPDLKTTSDSFPVPFYRFTRRMMPGVEIQADAAATIMSGFPLKEETSGLFFYPVYWLLAAALFCFRKRPAYLITAAAGIAAAIVSASAGMFLGFGILTEAAGGVCAVVCNSVFLGAAGYFTTAREKRFLRKSFEHYVSRELVEELVLNREQLQLGGRRQETSILFTDMVGFTALSERVEPEKLITILNLYFETVTRCITAHDGMVDKFMGDAVMALFGAPLHRKNHAVSACRAAIDIRKEMSRREDEWGKIGISMPGSATGIHTGGVIVGNIGASMRFDYTAVGDNVNLASRLESLCRIYGVGIIISESVQRRSGSMFCTRRLDRIVVAGRSRPTLIYELVAEKEQEHMFISLIDRYEEALGLYFDREWDRAASLLEELRRDFPHDRPSGIILERCRRFAGEGPPDEWDGTFRFDAK